MSPQTNQVLQDVAVKSYDNPEDIGNKALWPLRVSIVDVCFAVRTFVPKFLLYQMGKKQELPVPLWEKNIGFVDIVENIQSNFLYNRNYFCYFIYL